MSLHHHHGLFFAALAIFTISVQAISTQSFSIPSISHMHKHKQWETFHNFTSCRLGQTQKGLSTVKNYLHRFGYIPHAPPTNFSDVFDETLVFAIRSYQKNYHLNITGKLDDNTVKHMMQPRCGVPDIIHTEKKDTTTGKQIRSHFHMGSYYAFFDGNLRWPAGTKQLTYSFLPQNNVNNDYKRAFARAFSRWAPWMPFSFKEITSNETADIKIGFYKGDHGDGFPFDGPYNVLAHARPPIDGSFHLDAEEYWVASGDVTKSPVSRAIDLESVAVHEIGHLLGLDHSNDKKSVMWPVLQTRTRRVNLGYDDIKGIKVLYAIK
ncbi:metalloendoproteinase 1-like [Lotus japonicus]|uniref:metalloendoproteinase 1-like n=1 Tax=Lotus japonicus TaxID=34305 RepID=UPI00258D7642|nr:metalloendoproteinase 1-like [Lotus japonicus]